MTPQKTKKGQPENRLTRKSYFLADYSAIALRSAEGTSSEVDTDEDAWADNKSIRVLPKEKVESPYAAEINST